MSEMVAKVAKAMLEARTLRKPELSLIAKLSEGQAMCLARAAIEAMREHLEQMPLGSDEDIAAIEITAGLIDAALK